MNDYVRNIQGISDELAQAVFSAVRASPEENVPRFSLPTSSFGYYRGTPYYGGEGSGEGPCDQGVNTFSQGQGATGPPPVDYSYLYLIAGLGLAGFAIALLMRG